MKDFLFGVHLHQPVDNLQSAVDKAVNLCYGPLFETFAKYPEFRFSMHCSGWLFEKLKKEYKEVFENIKKCNIEFFSAGYYEPVLSVIPREDRIAQIRKLNSFIKENFGVWPKGMWLTERVWDDGIVSEINECGIEYVTVDDFHFKSIGIEPEGYFFTESNGKKLKIFPISKNLRYKIPFAKPDEAIKAVENEKIAVMFDDAEKFGLWPETFEWVYKKKWLEEFIEKSLSRLKPLHFSQYISLHKPGGIVYLPNVSYEEMQQWCLDTDVELNIGKNPVLKRGGVFKNFFRKYKESNHIHKRMLEMSVKKTQSLYKLQTNDVYWHGVFGGLYLPNLRDNAYRYLIECESVFEDGVFVKDIDYDGFDEIKVKKEKFILVFNKNGEIIEFDDRKSKFNFLNTLKRRKEAYHFQKKSDTNKKTIKTIHEITPEIEKYKNELFYDRYFRYSFIDHLVNDEINEDDFKKDCYKDFFKKDFARKDLNFISRQIEKKFKINECLEFEILNKTGFDYALEFNFHFASYDDLVIEDDYIFDPYTKRKIVFDFSYSKKMSFPVKTVSRDEKGFCTIIQGISFLFIFKSKNIKGKVCLK